MSCEITLCFHFEMVRENYKLNAEQLRTKKLV